MDITSCYFNTIYKNIQKTFDKYIHFVLKYIFVWKGKNEKNKF